MGSFFSFFKIFDTKEYRLLMLGLDGAGKTTVLYTMKLGDFPNSIPTIGFNYETLLYNKVKLNLWDCSGQDKLRILWKHYYTNTKALIFVIDSSDKERLEEVKEIIYGICSEEELFGVPLLILANKQDIASIGSKELKNKIGFHEIKGRNIKFQETCALDGTGLKEGFTWLVQELKKK